MLDTVGSNAAKIGKNTPLNFSADVLWLKDFLLKGLYFFVLGESPHFFSLGVGNIMEFLWAKFLV